LFDEFARLVATDAPRALSIVDSIISKKVKSELSGIKRHKKETISELDVDTLYNMINDSDDL